MHFTLMKWTIPLGYTQRLSWTQATYVTVIYGGVRLLYTSGSTDVAGIVTKVLSAHFTKEKY